MRQLKVEQYLHQVLDGYRKNFTTPSEDWPADICCGLDYLNENMFETICKVRSLYQECNLKQQVFSTRFRNYVGLSPIQYINLHRLEASKLLLSDRNLSGLFISEIGFFVGYEKPAAFSMLYIKNENMSPKEWRKMHRKQMKNP